MRDNELTRFIDSMAWLLDDEPKIRRYFEVNGKEIINDFKEKDEPKPKKENTSPTNPFKGCIADDKEAQRFAHPHTIKRVIINPPAVIILWGDDTKTIAKCEDGEKFDAEKGFAIAVAKHFVGNTNFREMLDTFIWDEEDCDNND